ncbi:hypothetical protein HRbin39_00057 [bacterium HR39]|nr:hypothetical protein HRbin39_00057 [bacterium HR39]
MDRHLRGLDHLVVAVDDLDEAAERWERLGFTLTPRGRHPAWGTANRCVLLEGGYVELLAVADPRADSPLAAALRAAGAGFFALAFSTDDPAATAAAWRTLGFSARGPEHLTRILEIDGEVELRFCNVMLPPEETLGLRLFACRHETPGLERRPEWLDHANRARRVVSVSVLAEPVEPVAELFERVLGTATRSQTDQLAAFHVGDDRVLVMPAEDVNLLHPEVEAEEREQPARFVSLQVRVEDMERVAEIVAASGLAHRRIADGIAVLPAELGGVALEFTGP